MAELTLVLPAYDEEDGIARVVEEAHAQLAVRCARFEILIVDDGSRDATGVILAALAARIPELRVLTQPANLGYAAALRRGFRAASFDPVLYTDADGQFDLADLDRAAPLLAPGVAFVAGYRARRADPWPRRLASAVFNRLARLALGVRAHDVDCAFKLFRRSFLDAIELASAGFLIDAEIYARAARGGYRFVQLPVTHRPRLAGRSTVRWSAVTRSARELLALRRRLAAENPLGGAARRFGWLAAAPLLALALALFAQGARGLGEPDEGRNAQIAATMLASGDWLVPRLDGLPYLDKPPLTFWLVAASLRLAGHSELAARLPLALAFAFATVCAGWLGSMLWGRRAGAAAALAYALSLGPFAGAAVLTPDTFLAAAGVATAALFWRATHGGGRRAWLLAGAAAGVGLMTKGAAMLVLAAPLFAAETVRRRGLRWLAQPGPWLALGVAVAVGTPWYLWTAAHLAGSGAYFLSNQVTGRLVEGGYDRNAQWSKIATLYLPTLLLGALPWSLGWPSRAARWVRELRARRASRPSEETLFVALAIMVPLAVFCAARSRLPLYLLPLFAPLAVWTGRDLARSWRGPGLRTALATVWIAGLLALKLFAAGRLDSRDGRRLAGWVSRGAIAGEPVWAVDADVHSLPFYGVGPVRAATSRPVGYPTYAALPHLEQELAAERPREVLLVTPQPRRSAVLAAARAAHFDCVERGDDLKLTLLDCSPAHPARLARARTARARAARADDLPGRPRQGHRRHHPSARIRAGTPSRTTRAR